MQTNLELDSLVDYFNIICSTIKTINRHLEYRMYTWMQLIHNYKFYDNSNIKI